MATYQPGDLVWAKMKGYPAWPAMVLSEDRNGEECAPHGKLSIFFFGTRETAFMRPADLYAYANYREQYEIPRKLKGFNEGIHEIRVQAGLETENDRDPRFLAPVPASRPATMEPKLEPSSTQQSDLSVDVQSPLASSPASISAEKSSDAASSSGRIRRPSALVASQDFVSGNRKRVAGSKAPPGDNGSGTPVIEKAASSTANTPIQGSQPELKTVKPEREEKSQTVDAQSQGVRRQKRVSISDKVSFDPIESLDDSHVNEKVDPPLFSPILGDVPPLSAIVPLEEVEESSTRHSRRTPRPKLFGDFILPHQQPRRPSISSTRTRLTSGVSDVFDDLLGDSFNAADLIANLDDAPPQSPPESPTKQKKGIKFCEDCGCQCEIVAQSSHNPRWRCTSKFCLKWNGTYDGPAIETAASTVKTASSPPAKKARLRLDASDSPLPSIARKGPVPRPKLYRVDTTPTMDASGQRVCGFCGGPVRPQMCGGNRHRWRCVDKKCRKWYSGVRSDEQMPDDVILNRKQPRVDEPAQTSAVLPSPNSPIDDDIIDPGNEDMEEPVEEEPRKIGRPPKKLGLKIRLKLKKRQMPMSKTMTAKAKRLLVNKQMTKPSSDKKEESTRKKASSASTMTKFSPSALHGQDKDESLSPRTLRFRASELEKRGRWWASERRRAGNSPEAQWQTGALDSTACFRLIAVANTAAAGIRGDEPGSVNGCLDLLMDSLMSSMAPLLSLSSRLPAMAPPLPLLRSLWTSSAVHTPIFSS